MPEPSLGPPETMEVIMKFGVKSVAIIQIIIISISIKYWPTPLLGVDHLFSKISENPEFIIINHPLAGTTGL